MSSYDEHLITQAGGDGEPSTSRELTEHQALCIWEDNVGDSGKSPNNLELLTFANAARDPLLALVREQQARLESVRALAAEWESLAGPGTEREKVFGPQKVSVEFAACQIRAALEPTP